MPDAPSEYSEETHNEVGTTAIAWFEQFANSPQFKELTTSQRQAADFMIVTMAEELYLERGLTQREWNVDAVEWVLTESYPQKVVEELDHFKAVSTTLAAFFRFLETRGELEGAGEIAERVSELKPTIVARAAGSHNENAALSILTAAAEQRGVSLDDIETVEDMEAFLDEASHEDIEIDPAMLEGQDEGETEAEIELGEGPEAEVDRVLEGFGELYEEFHEDHLHPDIEEDVAEIFQEIGPEAVPHLVDVIEEDERWAVRCAIRGLGRLGGEDATRALLDTIEREGYPDLVYEALVQVGPPGIPIVTEAVDERIANAAEAGDAPTRDGLVRDGLRVIGDVRCEASSTYLIGLLDAVAAEMAAAPEDVDKADLEYAAVDFSQLLDAIVKQGDEAAIESLETARDVVSADGLEFALCQIALGRLRLGETEEGYLPAEVLDIMMPPGAMMGALTGEDLADEDYRQEAYGKYFAVDGVDPPW